MNREDQDFGQLRRLLRLKRYEQPPPRYFRDFSARVVTRLEADQESGASDSWWQRLWVGLELRPAVPVALSAAVCGLLVLGAVYTENARVPQEYQVVVKESLTHQPVPSTDTASLGLIGLTPHSGLASFSTNPVPTTESLFNRISPPSYQRANHPLFQ